LVDEQHAGRKQGRGALQFRFSAAGAEIGGFEMKVLELQPAKRVLWQVVEGPAEWIGTLMSLKSLLETGKGSPNPNDAHISGDGPD
jgi:hypothetical protein